MFRWFAIASMTVVIWVALSYFTGSGATAFVMLKQPVSWRFFGTFIFFLFACMKHK